MDEHGRIYASEDPKPEDIERLRRHAAKDLDGQLDEYRKKIAEHEAASVPVADREERDEDSAGAELSRLEDEVLYIHDALVAAGYPGAINSDSIIERIEQLAASVPVAEGGE